MSDHTDEPADAGSRHAGAGASDERIGNVGEEAAKLFAALSTWARDQGSEHVGNAAGAAAAMSDTMRSINDHIATGSADCRYCPVCQAIQLVRNTNPEVKAHLAVATSSLMQAAAGMLGTKVPDRKAPVEKIDLEDTDWDDA